MNLHASCVAVQGKGLLILGPSGAGKSALALELMALGADLVADDRTDLVAESGRVMASCPPVLSGLIEARGLGLLRVPSVLQAQVVLAVDLGRVETERMPQPRNIDLCGQSIRLVHAIKAPYFTSSLWLALRHGGLEAA